MDEVERERLNRWLRFDTTSHVFPREVGKYRDVVNDFDEFLKWYEENRKSDFCWASLYSTDQINKSCFDTLFLDFDIEKAGAVGVANYLLFKSVVSLLSNYFPRVRLYYSFQFSLARSGTCCYNRYYIGINSFQFSLARSGAAAD